MAEGSEYIGPGDAFVGIECGGCAFAFAVPAHVRKHWKARRNRFFCPSCGCVNRYQQRSEAEVLRQQLEQAQRRWRAAREDAESCARSNRALRGTITKMRRQREAHADG